MTINKCVAAFVNEFESGDFRIFFAPGRINLIGEHTDCYGGHVFPCALTFGTYALAKKNRTQRMRMYSMNFPKVGRIEFPLADLHYNKAHDWANYPKGMLKFIQETGQTIDEGVDILFYGEIPNGAGLSSSASIEMVTAVALQALFDLPLKRLDLVAIGKKVENEFIGMNCGIMDQFAIGMGKAGHGMLLDCQTLNYSYVPLDLAGYDIVIMNSNKRRELVGSKYNERRAECEAALSKLQTVLNIKALGELDEATFTAHQHVIGNSTQIKRAKHAVFENRRTLMAVEELKAGNLARFCKLVNQSHISLRDDYEVTCPELDALVEAAWKQPGVLGSRMTGAGFGGCAIAFVKASETEKFIANVGHSYRQSVGYDADFYLAAIGDGARELEGEFR